MDTHRFRLKLFMPNHGSASRAIRDAEVANLTEDAAYAAESFRGCRCLDFRCDQDAIWLGMSNGKSLQIRVDEQGGLAVSIDRPGESGESSEQIEDYVLVWANSEEVWGRGPLLRACMGKTLRNVFYNGNELYLYWEDLPRALCFRPAKVIDTGRMLLYWHLTE